MSSPPLAIDGFPLLAVHRPATVAGLSGLVAEARVNGQGVYPIGGQTALDVGFSPRKPGIGIEMTALDQVIDYPARDMTVTVQAGITLARLQAELAKEGQSLPVDVALVGRATLGGAIALNQSGPRRYGYGTLRDYAIGISFVTDDAVEVKAGGRVVKNVAGYDLMKLQIGALGTLGIVTQVTLKVKPRPETVAGLVFGCRGDSLGPILDRLHASKSRPVAVEAMNRAAWQSLSPFAPDVPGFPWLVAVGFEEKAAAARWQWTTLVDELKGAGIGEVVELPEAAKLWTAVADLQVRPESRFIGKASVKPSQLASYLQELSASRPEAIIHAHALNGIAWIHTSDEPVAGESVLLRRCPAERKELLSAGGRPASWELMKHIKRTLDPDNVFNPGRLFGDV